MIKDAIILLSGGLDSLVSLGLVRNNYGKMLALTFDYGQKSVRDEIEASSKICDYYKINNAGLAERNNEYGSRFRKLCAN